VKLLTNKVKVLAALFILTVVLIDIQSCEKDDLLHVSNNIQMLPKLSDYKIFRGRSSDLVPSESLNLYEIATQLFSDHAEKQRLIKIPAGSKITVVNDGVPDFPEGTMLVKTFYYFNDKRDASKGKKIIETRLMIKSGSKWNVGTYYWNKEQNEAYLLTTGLSETVNWIDENGIGKVISFHIPSNSECATCHSSNSDIMPIGTKIRNWNFDVVRNNATINQLNYFENLGMLNPVNPSLFSSLPDWHNTALPIEQRARAYLDVNCAHCHNSTGFAANTHIVFSYETPFDETKIGKLKERIPEAMSSGRMPKLGTTTVDEIGLSLIKEYIETF